MPHIKINRYSRKTNPDAKTHKVKAPPDEVFKNDATGVWFTEGGSDTWHYTITDAELIKGNYPVTPQGAGYCKEHCQILGKRYYAKADPGDFGDLIHSMRKIAMEADSHATLAEHSAGLNAKEHMIRNQVLSWSGLKPCSKKPVIDDALCGKQKYKGGIMYKFMIRWLVVVQL